MSDNKKHPDFASMPYKSSWPAAAGAVSVDVEPLMTNEQIPVQPIYTDAAYLRTVGGVGAYREFAAGKAMLGAGEGMAKGGGGGEGGGGGGLMGGAGLGVGFGLAQMLVKDQIWLFGIDPDHLDEFIGEYGWRVVEHVGYDELVERYVRPTGRDLGPTAIERIVYAEKV